jgi:hypothetical protein
MINHSTGHPRKRMKVIADNKFVISFPKSLFEISTFESLLMKLKIQIINTVKAIFTTNATAYIEDTGDIQLKNRFASYPDPVDMPAIVASRSSIAT